MTSERSGYSNSIKLCRHCGCESHPPESLCVVCQHNHELVEYLKAASKLDQKALAEALERAAGSFAEGLLLGALEAVELTGSTERVPGVLKRYRELTGEPAPVVYNFKDIVPDRGADR